jgi:hypothetical protein
MPRTPATLPLLLVLCACSSKQPWVGRYAQDLSAADQALVESVNTDAAERGVPKIQEPTERSRLELTLAADGTFRFDRRLWTEKSVTTGRYSVVKEIDGWRITLTISASNGEPPAKPSMQIGVWTKREIVLEGWGTLQRVD